MKDPNRDQFETLAHHVVLPRLARGLTPTEIKDELFPILSKSEKVRPKDVDDMLRWLIWWVKTGLPHVVLDVKLAASFMATSIPSEFANNVPMPWEDFMLTIPANVISDRETTCIVSKGGRGEDGYNFVRVIFTDWDAQPDREGGGVMRWNVSEEWPRFADEPLMGKNQVDLRGEVIRERPRRRLKLVMRAIFGACAEIANRGGGTPGSRPRVKPGRSASEPTLWTIRLGRSVRIDCREYLRDYVSGERGSLSVQYMRRGHWRNQPHGPKSSLRKFIHIEPHWVGPEDAPIAVRSHMLGQEKSA